MIKHARQIASIVGNLEEAHLASDPLNTSFVEMGAGKGTLSCMLSETSGRGGSYYLLDRGTAFRNKKDKHTHMERKTTSSNHKQTTRKKKISRKAHNNTRK